MEKPDIPILSEWRAVVPRYEVTPRLHHDASFLQQVLVVVCLRDAGSYRVRQRRFDSLKPCAVFSLGPAPKGTAESVRDTTQITLLATLI